MKDYNQLVEEARLKSPDGRELLFQYTMGFLESEWSYWNLTTGELSSERLPERLFPRLPASDPRQVKMHPLKADMHFHVCRGEHCNKPLPFGMDYCRNCIDVGEMMPDEGVRVYTMEIGE